MTQRWSQLILGLVGQRSRSKWPGRENLCSLNNFKPIEHRVAIIGILVGQDTKKIDPNWFTGQLVKGQGHSDLGIKSLSA